MSSSDSPDKKRPRLDPDLPPKLTQWNDCTWQRPSKHWTLAGNEWQLFYDRCRSGKFVQNGTFTFPIFEEGKLIVRDCFKQLLEATESGPHNRFQEHILITGQSGIGKTVALRYLVGAALVNHKHEPIVYINRQTAWIFFDGNVWTGETAQCDAMSLVATKTTWRTDNYATKLRVFVNWDTETTTLHETFWGGRGWRIIQAAYPDPVHFRWIEQTQSDCKTIALPHWTKKELGRSIPLNRVAGMFFKGVEDYLKDPDSSVGNATKPWERAGDIIKKWWTKAKHMAIVEGQSNAPGMDSVAKVRTEGQQNQDALLVETIIHVHEKAAEGDAGSIYHELSKCADLATIPKHLQICILLTHSMLAVGLTPRDVLNFFFVRLESVQEHAENIAKKVSYEDLERWIQSFDPRSGYMPHQKSHDVVIMTPSNENPSREFEDLSQNHNIFVRPKWCFTFKTPYIGRAVMQHLANEMCERRVKIFSMFRDDPFTAVPAGRLFENMAPFLIARRRRTEPIDLYLMHQTEKPRTSDSDPRTVHFATSTKPERSGRSLPTPVLPFVRLSFLSGVIDHVVENPNCFVYSEEINTPLFDALLLVHDEVKNENEFVLWVLQIASSYRERNGSVQGYKLLEEIIDKLPKTSIKIQYVLVKPDMDMDDEGDLEVGEWKMPEGRPPYEGDVYCAYLPLK
ncbi:hypothetical protein PQX77_008816 [Marasmius sp. AFHP31]|nr:hypothetical protein PQX77_008816 [Marasmius sp. AFHP31]